MTAPARCFMGGLIVALASIASAGCPAPSDNEKDAGPAPSHPCVAANRCHFFDGAPACDAGYVFVEPGSSNDFRCAPSDCLCDLDASCDAACACDADCVCTAESDLELCTAAGVECASISSTDRCGTTRQPECGSCPAGETCTAGQCRCVPESDTEICTTAGAACGTLTTTNRCGSRTVATCGGCPPGQACGGGGQPNRCACAPESEQQLCVTHGYDCGIARVTDGCAQPRSIACGSTCPGTQTCGGAGEANRCGETFCTADGWCRTDASVAPPRTYLTATWMTGTSDIWVAGSHLLLLHYDGKAWKQYGDLGSSGQQFWSLWGTASDNIWVAGNEGLLYRFDGSTWSAHTGIGLSDVNEIFGLSANEVWAVGASFSSFPNGRVLYFDGVGWSMDTLNGKALLGVWGSAWNDLHAVGLNGEAWRYDGTTWSTTPSSVSTTLNDVWGSSATDLWAVGLGGVILHHDGSGWSGVQSPTFANLEAIHGSAANDIYAVGASGTILHYDGAAWTAQNSGTSRFVSDIYVTPSGSAVAVAEGLVLIRP